MVDDAITGRLVAPGDAAALAAALAAMMAMAPGERAAMGGRAREAVMRRFARGAYYDSMVRLYGEVQPSLRGATAA